MDILFISNLACFAAYLLLGVQFGVRRTLADAGLVFVLACGSTALAALVRGLEGLWGQGLATPAALLDVIRCASWVAFVALVYRDSLPAGSSTRAVRGLLLLAAFLTAALVSGALLGGDQTAAGLPRSVFLAQAAGWLLLVGIGLMFIDALLRQASPEARWQVKVSMQTSVMQSKTFWRLVSEAIRRLKFRRARRRE